MKFAIAVLQNTDGSHEVLSASQDVGEVLAAYRKCQRVGKLFFSDKISWDRSKRHTAAAATEPAKEKKPRKA